MRLITYGLVATLAGLLIVSMGAIAAVRFMTSKSVDQLRTHWVVAQTSVISLTGAYADEETGQRGFLLAGEPQFLAPLEKGRRTADRLEAKLESLLASDPAAIAQLHRVTAARAAWQTLADEQIAARRAGPLSQAELTTMALQGKQEFDILRARLAALTNRIDALANAELDRIDALNRDANLVTIAACALTVAVALLAVPALRRVLVRPLDGLIGRIHRVAGGNYDESIPAGGPAELAAIAAAVERMRRSILRSTDDLVAARQALTLRDERDRIAADLHDLTIQRVFALGLSLSAEVSRGGGAAASLSPLIDETDRIIQELRQVIFDVSDQPAGNLRAGISTLVKESARALGFSPNVEFRGPVDDVGTTLADEVLAVLHEALGNVVHHAGATRTNVTVTLDSHSLALSVTDDGHGRPSTQVSELDIGGMEARAARLGGQASITAGSDGGTTVEWRVPLDGAHLAEPDGPVGSATE